MSLEAYSGAGSTERKQILEKVGEPHKAAPWINRSGSGVADHVAVKWELHCQGGLWASWRWNTLPTDKWRKNDWTKLMLPGTLQDVDMDRACKTGSFT